MKDIKQYIDKVLGSSIRCLLPSYWWKRIFGLVVDEVEDVRKVANSKADKSVADDVKEVSLRVDEVSTKVDEIEKAAASAGLKYSIERTVYLTKMDLFGEIEDTFEITEEQREYNRETVRLASDNEMPVTLNKGGQMFAPYASGSSEARFIASYADETETWSITIFINDNGDAEGALKAIPMGATKEELTTLQTEVINNEEVTAAAINDLNARIGAAADTAYVDNAIASAITSTLNTEV